MELRWKAERYFVCFRSPLKRMTVGMLLASVAFVAAALVQLEIDVRTAIAAASTQMLNPHSVSLECHHVFSRKRCRISQQAATAK